MIEALKNFRENVEIGLNITGKRKVANFNKILYCGMGGSGIPGHILKNLVDVPVFVNQDYNIPRWVDGMTLCIVVSYSGNTKETVTMYHHAKKKTKNIVVISSGGKLGKVKSAIKVPGGYLPRNAFPYLFFSVVKLLANFGLLKINRNDIFNSIKKVDEKLAKKIAKKIHKKLPVVYAPSKFDGIALRWKQSFNENSKDLALVNSYPEIYHNEVEGNYRNSKVLILNDGVDKKLRYFGKLVNATFLTLKGKTDLGKISYAVLLGDYIVYYLAMLKKQDTNIQLKINKIKGIR